MSKTKRYETRTVTLVVQAVVEVDAAFQPIVTLALEEYVQDRMAGTAGNSGYERHVQKCGARIDVIASVSPDPAEIAREREVDGDGDRALIERLQKIRTAARFLPGQPNASVTGSAYTPVHAASDIAEFVSEALAAHGIVDEDDDDGGS